MKFHSLYVTLEVVKLSLSYFIAQDNKMYDSISKTPARRN